MLAVVSENPQFRLVLTVFVGADGLMLLAFVSEGFYLLVHFLHSSLLLVDDFVVGLHFCFYYVVG